MMKHFEEMDLDDERIQKLKQNGKGKKPVENPEPLEVSSIKESQEQKEFAFKKRMVIAIRDWPPECGLLQYLLLGKYGCSRTRYGVSMMLLPYSLRGKYDVAPVLVTG
ncbi:hypothetical protein E3N88_10009 [Mikania micrantha]|uniref:Uncharacterized protein n=1 Tax=Mikania micrantha TaxID=192012 RepID=A0A5N6PAI1_9ASTR|nr:hypothetical protein E3N88_10009 [Mikania micrantha]